MSEGGTYTRAEIAEVAAGLNRILAAVERGELTAHAGLIARLEGASAALLAMAVGVVVDDAEPLFAPQQD